MMGVQAFQGREVLVVGGTSGIGAGIAQAFLARGAQVRVTGATAGEVAAASQDAALAGAVVSALDVRDNDAVVGFIGGLDRLDVLVNCAGVIRRGQEHDPAVFAQVLDINLNGSMRTAAAARPLLAQSQGCIVNTASMLSFFGGGLVPGYSASKGGIAQLTKSLAIAYAADGIRVNAIAPGFFPSKMTAGTLAAVGEERLAAAAPLQRLGDDEDLKGVTLLFASDAGKHITGQVLAVDGGVSAVIGG